MGWWGAREERGGRLRVVGGDELARVEEVELEHDEDEKADVGVVDHKVDADEAGAGVDPAVLLQRAELRRDDAQVGVVEALEVARIRPAETHVDRFVVVHLRSGRPPAGGGGGVSRFDSSAVHRRTRGPCDCRRR